MGGTAAVYRGVSASGHAGAVKVMHAHLADDRAWARRLRREARLLGSVRHPGLVALLDFGATDDGAPFLVTELLEGCSLEELRQEKGGKLPVEDVFAYAATVLDVLSHTHALGIVHRDLKPSNVFLTDGGQLKVLDFGIASSMAAETLDGFHSATRGVLGTPAYMSPEQARGRWDLVDHRTDLWAVGAMVFTLASGQCVHVAVTENERLGLAMSRPARSLASALPELGRTWTDVIDRALSYDLTGRFQSAAEFRDALNAAGAPGVEPARSADFAASTLRYEPESQGRKAPRKRPGSGQLAVMALAVSVAVVSAPFIVSAFATPAMPAGDGTEGESAARDHAAPPRAQPSAEPRREFERVRQETSASASESPVAPASRDLPRRRVVPPSRSPAAVTRAPQATVPVAASSASPPPDPFENRDLEQRRPGAVADLMDRRE